MQETVQELKLYPYQEYGINWLMSNGSPIPKHSLLGDDMGLGKTAQMVIAAERLEAERILVLCPATIKINWMREFLKWTKYEKIFIVQSGLKHAVDKIPQDAQVVIVNYDMIIKPRIKKQILAMKFKVGIMDECQYLQSLTSQRTKAVLGGSGVIWTCEYKWAATGTFMPNRPKNIYPLTRSLAPYVIEPYLDYVDFAYRYCAAFMGGFGLDDNGCSNAAELGDRLKGFMLRRLKEEVLSQLPDKTLQYVYLEKTPKIERVLELEAELSEDERNAIIEFQNLGNQARIRHELALAKMDQCVAHIKEQMSTLNKVVIGFYHKKVLEYLKEQLSRYGLCVVTGGMTGDQKQSEVDEFVNNPDKKIFLGQIQAAGVGVDGLQLVCSDLIFVETSWVPGDIDQFIDRLRRIGQKSNVHVQFLTVPDSIEEDIIQSELTKRKNIKSVMSRVENIVTEKVVETSNKEEEKEKIMSLENEVSRVANALETIAELLGNTAEGIVVKQDAEATRAYANALAKDEEPNTPSVEVDHEKERLVAEAKRLGISGKVGAMSVENLKKKIAEFVVAQPDCTPIGQQPAPSQTVVQHGAVTGRIPAQQPQAVPQTVTANPAMVQKAAQDLVKKIGATEAAQYVQGIIQQVGGEVFDAVTGVGRPAKLADLNPEQLGVVLEATQAKLAE